MYLTIFLSSYTTSVLFMPSYFWNNHVTLGSGTPSGGEHSNMTSSPTLPASSNGLSRKFPMAVIIFAYSLLAEPLQIIIILFLLNLPLRENILIY